MPYTKKERKENVRHEKRDSSGRFAPKVNEQSSGPLNILSHLIKTGPSKDNETLLDVKVTNPLHRIVEVLQDIKNHQSTTFSFRFTIPLIALPVFLLVAFQLGRAQSACSQSFSSKIGTIKSISVSAPKETPDFFARLLSFIPAIPKLEKSSELMPEKRSLLINTQGEPFTVIHESSINLENYENRMVVLTGTISECTKTLTLDSPQNLTLLR